MITKGANSTALNRLTSISFKYLRYRLNYKENEANMLLKEQPRIKDKLLCLKLYKSSFTGVYARSGILPFYFIEDSDKLRIFKFVKYGDYTLMFDVDENRIYKVYLCINEIDKIKEKIKNNRKSIMSLYPPNPLHYLDELWKDDYGRKFVEFNEEEFYDVLERYTKMMNLDTDKYIKRMNYEIALTNYEFYDDSYQEYKILSDAYDVLVEMVLSDIKDRSIDIGFGVHIYNPKYIDVNNIKSDLVELPISFSDEYEYWIDKIQITYDNVLIDNKKYCNFIYLWVNPIFKYISVSTDINDNEYTYYIKYNTKSLNKIFDILKKYNTILISKWKTSDSRNYVYEYIPETIDDTSIKTLLEEIKSLTLNIEIRHYKRDNLIHIYINNKDMFICTHENINIIENIMRKYEGIITRRINDTEYKSTIYVIDLEYYNNVINEFHKNFVRNFVEK